MRLIRPEDVVGKKFGKLTILGVEPVDGTGRRKVRCMCDCGKETVKAYADLRNGDTTSCGCTAASNGKMVGEWMQQRSQEDIQKHIGQVFGKLEILGAAGPGQVKVKCACGAETVKRWINVKNKRTLSCGCGVDGVQRRRGAVAAEQLIGAVFGRLTVTQVEGHLKGGGFTLRCSCTCGKETVVRKTLLLSGTTKSCGCLRRETARHMCETRDGNNYQGLTGRYKVEYGIWHNFCQRCKNPEDPAYPNYGGRGIVVCPAWADPVTGFPQFIADVGARPSPELSLDRINNDGPYSPENVRWATRTVQSRNQRKRARIENFSDQELQAEIERRAKVQKGVDKGTDIMV